MRHSRKSIIPHVLAWIILTIIVVYFLTACDGPCKSEEQCGKQFEAQVTEQANATATQASIEFDQQLKALQATKTNLP